jgi:cytochrome oxidase Cu insertion factor (SCO1/SenC/PrrC family)/copper(I)-binding protein
MRDLVSARWSLIALLFVGISSCGSEQSDGAGGFRGVALPTPLAKPAITLTDLNGQPWDFAANTRGKVGLLFFGYTHCPDVCPLHMANIAAVLRRMSAEDRARIVTVFVTTDPERDTPARLREWLPNFDPSFVGLTGTKEELARAQAAVGVGEAQREYVKADSADYFVVHAAQVFAFARDGFAYTIYPFGIRQEDWANDLPKLARDSTGADIRRTLAAQARAGQLQVAPQQSAAAETNAFVISKAVVAEPTSLDEASAYLTFTNNTALEDTLVAVAADLAVRGEVHETMGEGEMRHMMSVPSVIIPSKRETKLAPGGVHVMLLQLRKKLSPGDTVRLFLSLARAGAVEVRAPVIPFADLERVLGMSGGPKK